jgi:ABC-type nitrate/sulfonate/bicarbonate transport system permease component
MGLLPRIGRWAAGPGAAVLTMAALLLLWEAAVVGLDIQRFLLPAPSDVVAEFIRDGRLIFFHAGQTVWGILAGYVAAVVFALAASMAMIRWPLVERMLMPILVASQSVPKIAIAPLILLWVGAGAGSKLLVVASIAFRWLYAENGLINGWLGALLGSAFTPIGFLTSPLLALPSVMVVTLWKGLGYYMVIFLAGLQGIPAELYEAAALDGCEGWQRHRHVTLPLLLPYVFLVAVISALGATKVFDEVFLMTQGGPADSTRTLVYYVYDQAFGELEISYACTVGLALFLIVLALSLLRSALAGGERGLG